MIALLEKRKKHTLQEEKLNLKGGIVGTIKFENRQLFSRHPFLKKLNIIEVFSFKDSDFVVTLPFEQFKDNLLNVYNYYIQIEKYELCSRIKKIETKLDNELKKLNTHEKK